MPFQYLEMAVPATKLTPQQLGYFERGSAYTLELRFIHPLKDNRRRAMGPPPSLCISFAYRARSEVFASIFSFFTSSHLACSARPGAHHSLLSRRSGTSLIYCPAFNTERGPSPPSHRAVVVDTFSIYCLLCAKRPVHK